MVDGVGIGLRSVIVDDLLSSNSLLPKFVELAPENWMGIGGKQAKQLSAIAELYPITCHGLSLSLGSPEPLDWDFLEKLKVFLSKIPVQLFSEHLSYCKCDNAHLHDLLPIPFREDAACHVAERIRLVQEFLERRIAIENVSYYTPIVPEMDEASFISLVLEKADCDLLLDVNNVYINAFNHQYDAKAFIEALPLDRVTLIHMAGHEQISEDLIVDTHGQEVIPAVFELFEWTIEKIDPVPVLLERDIDLPPFAEMMREVGALQEIMDSKWEKRHVS